MLWQSKDQLVNLLSKLVEYPSVSGTSHEISMAEFIHLQLQQLTYFKENPDHLQLNPISDGRLFPTALVKKPHCSKTVILLSHFDVVGVEDYGKWKSLAFHPQELTQEFLRNKGLFSPTVQKDLESGEWLFGRGTMDMKAGLALQMSMIERATYGDFEGNLLLLSVPDEEVNSAGMIGSIPKLVELAKTHNLEYTACLNSEPMFSKFPGDKNYYIYTGSIGKTLPGFFCFGKETHVGEPFSGLNANLMVSELTRVLELNTNFCEVVDGEVTPPPTNLMQKDLKIEYNVQIPHSAVTVFNVLFMKHSLKEMTRMLVDEMKVAANRIEQYYLDQVEKYRTIETFDPQEMKVNVFTYEQLLEIAIEKYGQEEIERRQNYLHANRFDQGDRDFSTKLVQDLALICKEHSPMIVLFYSPPFYPAVSSSHEKIISSTRDHLLKYAKDKYDIDFKSLHYFSGLSDLSFIGLKESKEELNPLLLNMPLFEKGYVLPLEELDQLKVPVLNVGPFGRDAHQWTERLNLPISFGIFPDLIAKTIDDLLRYGDSLSELVPDNTEE